MSASTTTQFTTLRDNIEDVTNEFITLQSAKNSIATERQDFQWADDIKEPVLLFETSQQLLDGINLAYPARGIDKSVLNTILQTNIEGQPLFTQSERKQLSDLFDPNNINQDVIQGKVLTLKKIYDLMLLSLIKLKGASASLDERLKTAEVFPTAMEEEGIKPVSKEAEEIVSLPPPPQSVFATGAPLPPPTFPPLPEIGGLAVAAAVTPEVVSENLTFRKKVVGTKGETIEERAITFMDTSDLEHKRGGVIEEEVKVRDPQGNIILKQSEVSPLRTFSPERDLFSKVEGELESLQTAEPQRKGGFRRIKKLPREKEVGVRPRKFPKLRESAFREPEFEEEVIEEEPPKIRFEAQATNPSTNRKSIPLTKIDEQIRRNELAMRDQDVIFRDDVDLPRRREFFERRLAELQTMRDDFSLGNVDPRNVSPEVEYWYDLVGQYRGNASYAHGPYENVSSAKEDYRRYGDILNQYQAGDIPLSFVISATRGIADNAYDMGCCGENSTYTVEVLRLTGPSSRASSFSNFSKSTTLPGTRNISRALYQKVPKTVQNTYLVFTQPWNEDVIHSRYGAAFREYLVRQGLNINEEPDRQVHIGFVRYISPIVVSGWSRALQSAVLANNTDPVFADIIYCGKLDAPCYGVTMAVYQVRDELAEELADRMESLPYEVDKTDDHLEDLREKIQNFTLKKNANANVKLRVRPDTEDVIAVNVRVDQEGYNSPQTRSILEGTYGLINNYGYAVDQDNSSIQVDDQPPQKPPRLVLERPFVPY